MNLNQEYIQPDNPSVPLEHKPEWLRINVAAQIFGLSRSKLYELISARRIKSIALRERGKLKGIRLINADSVRALLEQAVKQEAVENES